MITAADIEILIASGEGYNVEFKVSIPSKVRELTEEVCAFANAAGGIILIGISDSNEMPIRKSLNSNRLEINGHSMRPFKNNFILMKLLACQLIIQSDRPFSKVLVI
jgi:predicted HTH transcriptional regulator